MRNIDHDSSYKYLFSHPTMVRDLITGFIPDAWLHSLDFSTLERYPTEFISDDFQRRSDDIIWRIQAGEDWVYLYFLIEFQSTPDRYMALRVMVYLGLFYQDLLKHNQLLADGRLPPVLPIVLYNGNATWNAPQEIGELIAAAPGLVKAFHPQLKYFLIDEHVHSDSELASQKNLVAAIFRFEHSAPLESFPELVALLKDWLADQPQLGKMLARWLRATLQRKGGSAIALPEIDDLQELRVMLAERIEQWAQEKEAKGMQQGMQQGRLQGVAKALSYQLSLRFGTLPTWVDERLYAASEDQLMTWISRALTATSLDDLFANH